MEVVEKVCMKDEKSEWKKSFSSSEARLLLWSKWGDSADS